MKTITYQTDKRHSGVIQKYGCLFKSIGYFSKKDISVEEQNIIWDILVRNGYITGDLNGDGDVDDASYNMREYVQFNSAKVITEIGDISNGYVFSGLYLYGMK